VPCLAADPGIPYTLVAIEEAAIELPVPVDWVKLPVEEGGPRAIYISVPEAAELSVFSVPFETHPIEASAAARASEIRSFVGPASGWEDVRGSIVEVAGAEGLAVRAVWKRPDRPADVCALAFPTAGRTALIVLIMEQKEASLFETMTALLVGRTRILSPAEADAPPERPWLYEDPRGFSLTLPAMWRRISPAEVDVLSSDAGMPATEVVGFVRPTILWQSPNVILDLNPTPLRVSEDSLRALETSYREILGSRGPYTLDRASIVKVGQRDAMLLEGRTAGAGGDVRQLQHFVPIEDRTLILTASAPMPGEAAMKDIEAIAGSLSLVSPPQPKPEPDKRYGTIVIIAGLGAAALVALVVILVLRRRRA